MSVPESLLTTSARRQTILRLAILLAAMQMPGLVQASSPVPAILVLGDSLSAEYGLPRGSGWVALLEQRLRKEGKEHRVINASISGETTAGGRTRLPALLTKHQPQVVVIELGGNDALRGLPLASTETNLREMIKAAQASKARVLVLGMQMPPNYGASYARSFEAVFEKASRSEQASLVPFFLKNIGERIELFQADRIHPNEQAQPLMLDNVWPALRRLL